MKVARILLVALMLAGLAGFAHAQTARLSWTTCPTQTANADFNAAQPPPRNYVMILSATGTSGGNVGHESTIHICPATGQPFPDAWRYDDSGCQTGSQLTLAQTGPKTCPAMKGASALAITQYSFDGTCAHLILNTTYDTFNAVAATRYTLWSITFNHDFSVVGPGDPGVTCGGAEQCLSFTVDSGVLLLTGQKQTLGTEPGDARVTWNDGSCAVVVPTQQSTWGRMKNQYR